MWNTDHFGPLFPFFCRLGVQFTYFGICLNIAGFGLSLYLTQLTFACIEFPSKISVYFFVEKVGRKPSEMGAVLLTGLCLFINLFIAKGYTLLSFNQICPSLLQSIPSSNHLLTLRQMDLSDCYGSPRKSPVWSFLCKSVPVYNRAVSHSRSVS